MFGGIEPIGNYINGKIEQCNFLWPAAVSARKSATKSPSSRAPSTRAIAPIVSASRAARSPWGSRCRRLLSASRPVTRERFNASLTAVGSTPGSYARIVRAGARSRLISPDHARLVAETGGVIGVWPPHAIFPDLTAMANGMARLADVVGVDHVGLGSDMLGLVGASVFNNYRQLPDLAEAMLAVGFSAGDVGKVLGGNYARVFAATMT